MLLEEAPRRKLLMFEVVPRRKLLFLFEVAPRRKLLFEVAPRRKLLFEVAPRRKLLLFEVAQGRKLSRAVTLACQLMPSLPQYPHKMKLLILREAINFP